MLTSTNFWYSYRMLFMTMKNDYISMDAVIKLIIFCLLHFQSSHHLNILICGISIYLVKKSINENLQCHFPTIRIHGNSFFPIYPAPKQILIRYFELDVILKIAFS